MNVKEKTDYDFKEILSDAALWTSDVDLWSADLKIFKGRVVGLIPKAINQQERQYLDQLKKELDKLKDGILENLHSDVHQFRNKLLTLKEAGTESSSLELVNEHHRLRSRLENFEVQIKELKGELLDFENKLEGNPEGHLLGVKKILIPVDFSDSSKKTLDYAFQMFGGAVFEIHLLYVFYGPFEPRDSPLDVEKVFLKKAKQEFASEMDRIEERFKNTVHKVEMHSMIGKLDKCIEVHIKQQQIDLIVMGTKGGEGIKGLIYGTNTSQVALKSAKPVLVVPFESAIRPPRRITVFSDLGLTQMPKGAGVLSSLAGHFSSEVNMVNFRKPDDRNEDDALKALKQQAKFLGVEASFSDRVILEDLEESMSNYLLENTTDLLVLTTHHSGTLSGLFRQSVTKKSILHRGLPMLVLHYAK